MSEAAEETIAGNDEPDPLTAIGHEIRHLDDRLRALKLQDADDGVEAACRRADISQVEDRLDCLRAYATTRKATSLEGALVQLSIAFTLFAEAADPDRQENGRRRAEARFKRCMFSAIAPIVEALGPEGSAYDLGVYVQMPEHLDAWIGWERSASVVLHQEQRDRQRSENFRADWLRAQSRVAAT